MMNSGDNREHELRSRQARREGLFYLGCVVVAALIGFVLLWWPR